MTRVMLALAISLVSCSSTPALTTAPPRLTAATTLFVTTSAPTASPSATTPVFRFVAIGASDAVGVGASDPRTGSWPARVAGRLPAGTDVVNLGVSGSLAAQAGRDQVPSAVAVRPQL